MTDIKSKTNFRGVLMLIAGLVIGAVFLLSPVKGWLNSHPLIFKVMFPALLIFTAYGLVQDLREKAGWQSWLGWAVALVAALAASLWAFGAGVIFHTVGRITAILFVLLEVVVTVLDIVKTRK